MKASVRGEGNCGRVTNRGKEACEEVRKRRVCTNATRTLHTKTCQVTNGNPIVKVAPSKRPNMPWVDYRELCHRLDMIEVLGWMDWHATERRGETLRGSCLFCGTNGSQKDREFSVHCRRKIFRCFRCKQGGKILDLWSRYYKIDLTTAANELNKNLGEQLKSKSSNWESQPHRPSI